MSIWNQIKKQEDVELSEDGKTLDVCTGWDHGGNKYVEIPIEFVKHALHNTPSDEEISEPIQNALYATGNFLTHQCDTLADGILTYLDDTGFKIVKK